MYNYVSVISLFPPFSVNSHSLSCGDNVWYEQENVSGIMLYNDNSEWNKLKLELTMKTFPPTHIFL